MVFLNCVRRLFAWFDNAGKRKDLRTATAEAWHYDRFELSADDADYTDWLERANGQKS